MNSKEDANRWAVVVQDGRQIRPDGRAHTELRIDKRFEEKTVASGTYEACWAAWRLLTNNGEHLASNGSRT